MELFNKLQKFKKIIVTGPQRSGTRIISQIIAHETKAQYIDEENIGYSSLNLLFKHLFSAGNHVIHAPTLSCCCHLIDTPSTAIVFSFRDLNDIINSQNRIGWNKAKESLATYFLEKGEINQIKYEIWKKFQKPNIKIPYFEVDYLSFSDHPLWIENRENFKWNQTKYLV